MVTLVVVLQLVLVDVTFIRDVVEQDVEIDVIVEQLVDVDVTSV